MTVAACRSRPTAGAACPALDRVACDGTGGALVCELPATASTAATVGGVWTAVGCRGTRGCTHGSGGDACDDTTANAGDACPRNPPLDYACTPDKSAALVCKDGHFDTWRACRGPDGCVVEAGRTVRCDTTLGQTGDPCGQAGAVSCQADGKAMLACDGAHLAVATSCRGPQGCHADRVSGKVTCDDSLAAEGDRCDQDGRIACSEDHKAELACTAGVYAKKRECRRTDCRLDGDKMYCD